MSPLDKTLSAFLQAHHDPTRPLLLALSGGPDSLAVLHLLLDYQTQHTFRFGIAHINHNWRLESSSEALQLQQFAKEAQVPFHLKILDPKRLQGNLEAASRQERLLFFAELCKEHHYQAVLLGHHADDQSETVLKRVLEGATLPQMGGLQKCTQWEEISLWRPLLDIPKATILQWLDSRGLKGFHDETNTDSRFLRARLRTQIIPDLTKSFGKEVSTNLCHLGQDAQELRSYLEKSLSSYLLNIERGPHGSLLDLSESCPEDRYPLKFLIQELCKQEGFLLSRPQLETACKLVLEGTGDRYLQVAHSTLYIDRRRLFAMSHWQKESFQEMSLQPGKITCGQWNITVTEVAAPQVEKLGWKEAWRGGLSISLPAGDYRLGPPHLQAAYPGSHASLSKWWTNEKVPALLRQFVPVIWQGDRLYHEFLSSRSGKTKKPAKSWLHVHLCAARKLH